MLGQQDDSHHRSSIRHSTTMTIRADTGTATRTTPTGLTARTWAVSATLAMAAAFRQSPAAEVVHLHREDLEGVDLEGHRPGAARLLEEEPGHLGRTRAIQTLLVSVCDA